MGGPDTSPVFVVGLARSGTTLMAVCLDRHPAFDCGPETHLFARLSVTDESVLLDTSRWPGPATDFLCSLMTDGVRVHEAAGIGRDRIGEGLAARAPSVSALLESVTVTQARDAGKPRWVEKTPRHLRHVARIRALWPDAAIILMVRDPRARAVSMARMPFGSDSQVWNLLDGVRRDQRAQAAIESDPRLLRVRLEDLVAAPEDELRRVCEFLGEPWCPAMLEASATSSAVGSHEWWKTQATAPIQTAAAVTWHQDLPPAAQRVAALYCAGQLTDNGYPGSRTARASITLVPPNQRVAQTHEAVVLALALADVTLVDMSADDVALPGRSDGVVFWGVPGQLLPERRDGPLGWRDTARLLMSVVRLRSRGRPVWWVDQRTRRHAAPRRPQERWFARSLRVLARRATPDDLVEQALRLTSARSR